MASIEQRKGSYRITISWGFDENGKRIKHTKSWIPPKNLSQPQIKKELQKQAIIFEEAVKSGNIPQKNQKITLPKPKDNIDNLQGQKIAETIKDKPFNKKINSSITLDDFAKIWFRDYAENQIGKRTIQRYMDLMKRISVVLGSLPLKELSPYHLILFYDALDDPNIRTDTLYILRPELAKKMKEKRGTRRKLHEETKLSNSTIDKVRKGLAVAIQTAEKVSKFLNIPMDKAFITAKPIEPLSGQTLLHYHRFLSSILNTAVYWQIIFDNPCRRVKPPKVLKKEARYLTEKDVVRLLSALEKESIQFKVMVYLLLYTGIRRGELCGLEWNDIDFDNEMLSIQRSTSYLPKYGIFDDTTKTEGSTRTISISGAPVTMLKDYYIYQITVAKPNHNRLFSGKHGNPIRPDTITKEFHSFIERNDLPNVSVHSLRHTHATLLISNNMDIQTVSGRLGHARTSTTLNIYSHAIRSKDKKASEAIGEIIPYRSNTHKFLEP